jgi:anti-anti-sigma factor
MIEAIQLSGELDISRKDELRKSLAVPQEARAILLDCVEVTYADSTALAELLGLWDRARKACVPIALLVGETQFVRLVHYAGLEEVLSIFTDRGEALAFLEKSA